MLQLQDASRWHQPRRDQQTLWSTCTRGLSQTCSVVTRRFSGWPWNRAQLGFVTAAFVFLMPIACSSASTFYFNHLLSLISHPHQLLVQISCWDHRSWLAPKNWHLHHNLQELRGLFSLLHLFFQSINTVLMSTQGVFPLTKTATYQPFTSLLFHKWIKCFWNMPLQ